MSSSDASPVRRPMNSTSVVKRRSSSAASDSDASPPRRPSLNAHSSSSPVRKNDDSDSDASPPRRAIRPGLHTAEDIAREAREAREQKERAAAEALAHRKVEEVAERVRRRTEEARAEEARKEEERIAALAFGASRNDAELNRRQRKRTRWGDPMAKNRSGKDDKGGVVRGGSAKKDSDEEEEDYDGPPAPPNRFGINPGPRWDGIDRSNGFEQRLFERRAAKKARDADVYRRDMSGL